MAAGRAARRLAAMTGASRLCGLHLAMGREQACPRGACPFWEDGGAVVDAGCAVERLGIDLGRRDLAEYLLEIRTTLDEARSREERAAARASFAELVPSDLAGR
jgi:hypothetical protein